MQKGRAPRSDWTPLQLKLIWIPQASPFVYAWSISSCLQNCDISKFSTVCSLTVEWSGKLGLRTWLGRIDPVVWSPGVQYFREAFQGILFSLHGMDSMFRFRKENLGCVLQRVCNCYRMVLSRHPANSQGDLSVMCTYPLWAQSHQDTIICKETCWHSETQLHVTIPLHLWVWSSIGFVPKYHSPRMSQILLQQKRLDQPQAGLIHPTSAIRQLLRTSTTRERRPRDLPLSPIAVAHLTMASRWLELVGGWGWMGYW